MSRPFVLITAAYNEAKYIEQTVLSIIAQDLRPTRWIVVSDGSTDGTDEIVLAHAKLHPFITLYRITEDHPRNFAAQVFAINKGIEQLQGEAYDFIGNMDADITLGPDYFAQLMQKFEADPKLGLAGGSIVERATDGEFYPRKLNAEHSVAHACQIFRRECFEGVGGRYQSLKYGGPDTVAEVSARMNGWKVASFKDLRAFHHRPTNGAEGALKGCFRQGKMDYSLGALPAFEVLKLLRRVPERPVLIGALARAAGFVDCYLKHDERAVPVTFMRYLRQEQAGRLRALLPFS